MKLHKLAHVLIISGLVLGTGALSAQKLSDLAKVSDAKKVADLIKKGTSARQKIAMAKLGCI